MSLLYLHRVFKTSHKSDNAFLSIICPLCSTSTNFITDQESTETICIKCGCIVTNYKIQDQANNATF
ncbi:MAG: TFIIB-type zinc ribbon-containing protein [Candidatus Nitrosocosmicus sp.]